MSIQERQYMSQYPEMERKPQYQPRPAPQPQPKPQVKVTQPVTKPAPTVPSKGFVPATRPDLNKWYDFFPAYLVGFGAVIFVIVTLLTIR